MYILRSEFKSAFHIFFLLFSCIFLCTPSFYNCKYYTDIISQIKDNLHDRLFNFCLLTHHFSFITVTKIDHRNKTIEYMDKLFNLWYITVKVTIYNFSLVLRQWRLLALYLKKKRGYWYKFCTQTTKYRWNSGQNVQIITNTFTQKTDNIEHIVLLFYYERKLIVVNKWILKACEEKIWG